MLEGVPGLLGTGLTSELPFPYLYGGLTATLWNCCEDSQSENAMCLEERLELTVSSARELEGSGSGGGRPAEAGEAPGRDETSPEHNSYSMGSCWTGRERQQRDQERELHRLLAGRYQGQGGQPGCFWKHMLGAQDRMVRMAWPRSACQAEERTLGFSP